MSRTKIPFILLVTWGFNVCMTAPNPPPPKHERMSMESPIFTKWVPFIARTLQLCFGIAEIGIILASATPSWPLSKTVLSLLTWSGGKPGSIRMSNTAALGVFMLVLGVWIRLMTFRHLGQFFRFEASIQKDHELIVSGPYSVVRHPSYTGLMLIFIGELTWQFSKGSWVIESGMWNTILGRTLLGIHLSPIILSVYLVLGRMSKEDTALRQQFGTKWDDWAKKVPYSIFPGIY